MVKVQGLDLPKSVKPHKDIYVHFGQKVTRLSKRYEEIHTFLIDAIWKDRNTPNINSNCC